MRIGLGHEAFPVMMLSISRYTWNKKRLRARAVFFSTPSPRCLNLEKENTWFNAAANCSLSSLNFRYTDDDPIPGSVGALVILGYDETLHF